MSVLVNYALIGRRIKEYRRKHELTQAELAEKAGICQQFLGALERGKGVPSLETVLALCDALSLKTGDLLDDSAEHDFNPPCRLRDDHLVFDCTLTSQMLAGQQKSPFVLDPGRFPPFDLILPDTDYDREPSDGE